MSEAVRESGRALDELAQALALFQQRIEEATNE